MSLPMSHTRALRSEFVQKFGQVTPFVKPALLQYFYTELIGDSSSSETSSQEQIDETVMQAIKIENRGIVLNFRHLNTG